jgi:S1-C subfamily serine protease
MFLFLFSCLLSGEISEPDSYSVEWVEVGYKKTTNKITDSSVKIVIFQDKKEAGHGSGNYFTYNGMDFILTAAHVVEGNLETKISDGKDLVNMKIVFIDFSNDVAILKPETKLKNAKPMRWALNKSKKLKGISVHYSGYPSHYGNLLIGGMVSSYTNEGIVIQSFALPGSSGSVVFDESGRVVGVVSAVGLHMSNFSPYPSIQENIVFVSSVRKLSTKLIMEVLECGG